MPELLYENRGAAVWLTLNRPAAMNALTATLMRELSEGLDRAQSDASIRAIVLTGAGRAFCAGADLANMAAGRSLADTTRAFIDLATPVVTRLAKFPKPTIAAINGLALAGGFELMLACDLVVAADEARLGDAHANFGLVPAGGSSVRLPRRIGTTHAKYMIMSGELATAGDLCAAGLINQVVPGTELVRTVDALVAKLAAKSPLSLHTIKVMIDEGLELTEDEAIAREADLAVAHCLSRDAQEGIAAFTAKRTPRFEGG